MLIVELAANAAAPGLLLLEARIVDTAVGCCSALVALSLDRALEALLRVLARNLTAQRS